MTTSSESPAETAPIAGLIPHESASEVPALASLRRVLPRRSAVRATFDRCAGILRTHKPAAPPYVIWNLTRFALTIEFLRPAVKNALKWLEIGSDPWFCLLVRHELGEIDIVPTNYCATDLLFETLAEESAYQFRSIPIRIESGFRKLADVGGLNLITAFEVLEHLPEHPGGFLSAVNAALPQGGRLVLSTPNIASWSSIERLLDGATPHMTPLYGGPMQHRKEYTVWEVQQLLTAAGFRIERVETHDVYTNDRRGWRSGLLKALQIAWHALSGQPRRVRNLLVRSGSTTFVDAVKISDCNADTVAQISV